MKDDYAIVLDFLTLGHTSQARSHPVAQVLGENFFNLLEVIPQDGTTLKTGDKVYIGQGKREQIRSIVGKITSEKLTANAFSELEHQIRALIEKDEKRFIDFYNTAGPLTTKLHQLELLHGIGKKHMWEIIEARKKKKFESFKDLKERVTLIPNPENLIIKRIIKELEGKEKWYAFVTPPKAEDMRRF